MIIGTGIDIVSVERIRRIMRRWGGRFLKRVFTQKEIDFCKKKHKPELHFASRFAAKEAILKGLQTGMAEGAGFHDICISSQVSGAPAVELSGRTYEISKKRGIHAIHISLSDEDQFAVACAVLTT